MKPKRAKRRIKREEMFGPEMPIVSTTDGIHTLSCGHTVLAHETERSGPRPCKRRRCGKCNEIDSLSEM